MPILTSGTSVSYKLDTGSQVNIIPHNIFHALQKKPKVYTAKEKLMTYDRNRDYFMVGERVRFLFTSEL